MQNSLRRSPNFLYGKWVCPDIRVKTFTAAELASFYPDLSPDDFDKGGGFEATSLVTVLNLNTVPVDVLLVFMDFWGNYVPELTTWLNGVPPHCSRDHRFSLLGCRKSGWLRISCKRPIYPSGYITEMIYSAHGASAVWPDVGTQVEIPMFFYPVYEEDVITDDTDTPGETTKAGSGDATGIGSGPGVADSTASTDTSNRGN